MIEQKINTIIQDSLNLTNFHFSHYTYLDDIGIDSIEKAGILVKLQKEFSLQLDLSEFQSLMTMQDIYHYIGQNFMRS